MNPLVMAAVASFILGVTGYIIVQFWMRPIWRYVKLKRHIQRSLEGYLTDPSANQAADLVISGDTRLLHRLHATQLHEAWYEDVPHWYKILLQSRQETPLKAAEHLMNLSNIKRAAHARTRVEQISDCLKLSDNR